jgi:hypothetical protein
MQPNQEKRPNQEKLREVGDINQSMQQQQQQTIQQAIAKAEIDLQTDEIILAELENQLKTQPVKFSSSLTERIDSYKNAIAERKLSIEFNRLFSLVRGDKLKAAEKLRGWIDGK